MFSSIVTSALSPVRYVHWASIVAQKPNISSPEQPAFQHFLPTITILCFMFLWPCIVSKAWRKNTNKMQQYRWFIVNCRCWLLTTFSTCFGHLYAHRQEKRPRVTAYGMYLLVVLDVAVCGTVVLRWGCDHCEGCCRVWALWRLL